MIRKPNNWENVKEFSERQKLPLGAYVCKVSQAAVQHTDYGEQLCILFDIAEGDFAGFYKEDFDANTNADKKWRGVLRQFLPKDDGSQKDEWTKSSFKGMVTSFEKSNPGYHFDWNEQSIRGKMIGVLFRNEEWEYDGKTGWAVRPFRAISVDSVRSGDFTLPKDKPLNRGSNSSYAPPVSGYSDSYQNFAPIQEDDSALPF